MTDSSSHEEQFDQHQEDTMSYPYPKYHYSASKFEEVISKTTSGGGCQEDFFIGTKRANANNISGVRLQRTITRTIPLDEVLAFPDIPPMAHEFVALLQVDTSYELDDWLAKRYLQPKVWHGQNSSW